MDKLIYYYAIITKAQKWPWTHKGMLILDIQNRNNEK